jgi:hypothetical protein
MSHETRQSHATVWPLVLVLPLLYILTVPMVTFTVLQPKSPPMITGILYRVGGEHVDKPPPVWLWLYCLPFDRLIDHTPLGDPLRAYAHWCWRILGK